MLIGELLLRRGSGLGLGSLDPHGCTRYRSLGRKRCGNVCTGYVGREAHVMCLSTTLLLGGDYVGSGINNGMDDRRWQLLCQARL